MTQKKRESERKKPGRKPSTAKKRTPETPSAAKKKSVPKKESAPKKPSKTRAAAPKPKRSADRDDKKPFSVSRKKGKEKELVWDDPRKTRAPKKRNETPKRTHAAKGLIRLNRYIANAGICSRREADVLIKAGTVKVNGEIVTEMGVKVGPDDVVHYGDQKLSRERLVYVLLNKPKDFVTTTRDPQGRRTVMHLVRSACKERIVPVGRLDRQTTGLLMLTNDGDLAKKLTHPKHGVAKLYHVQVNKKVSRADLNKLLKGIDLEDGFAKADKAAYVGDNERELGLEIHMGKNRIVRRLMEALGYRVVKLDRVMFAGLTKKNLPRGKFRFLTETEVNQLKMR